LIAQTSKSLSLLYLASSTIIDRLPRTQAFHYWLVFKISMGPVFSLWVWFTHACMHACARVHTHKHTHYMLQPKWLPSSV
jgi:hypothetical protein